MRFSHEDRIKFEYTFLRFFGPFFQLIALKSPIHFRELKATEGLKELQWLLDKFGTGARVHL